MLTRREFLAATTAAAALAAAPSDVAAQTPKRGGTLSVRAWDPPHFDHSLGFPASICFNSYGSTVLVDTVQLVMKQLKAVGIDARLDQKEYGAYQASCRLGKFDSMVFGPLTPFLEPDNFLFGQYYTGEPRNRSHVKDPALDDLLVRQRRAMDVKSRREIINDIQRNLGYDYGGRVITAWLDR